jgi:hypothetical protein
MGRDVGSVYNSEGEFRVGEDSLQSLESAHDSHCGVRRGSFTTFSETLT